MRTLQGILLSLLVHFVLVWLAQFVPPYTPRMPQIQVEIIEATPSRNSPKQQIVRSHDAPEELKTDKSLDKLRQLSDQIQDVRKQVRALKSGMTENRAEQSENEQKKIAQNQEKPTDPRQRGGLNPFVPEYKKTPNFKQELNRQKGMSTFGEVLPEEVEIGSFTALNTDRYQFYTFYARIEELIRFRWENSVRMTIDRTPQADFMRGANQVWITQIEIWIKPNGEFHSAHLLKPSGIPGFDQAAGRAFRDARLFPNPPKEMVEDGMIRLQYSFNVNYNPKTLVGR